MTVGRYTVTPGTAAFSTEYRCSCQEQTTCSKLKIPGEHQIEGTWNIWPGPGCEGVGERHPAISSSTVRERALWPVRQGLLQFLHTHSRRTHIPFSSSLPHMVSLLFKDDSFTSFWNRYLLTFSFSPLISASPFYLFSIPMQNISNLSSPHKKDSQNGASELHHNMITNLERS